MVRKFKLSDKGQISLRCANWFPVYLYVEGDAKTGYDISYVDKDLGGFHLVSLRSFYAVKTLVEQINETGTTDFAKYCSVGSFAWANIPIQS